MADDTSAALIAQLDVKFDQLASNMKKALTVFDNGGRALEKRQAKIKKNLSDWSLKFTGLDGLKTALIGLSAAGIVGGIGEVVKKSLDAASAIGDVAIQAGVSVERLQQLRFAASQSGASFDIMDQALTVLNKSLGDFVNTGAGKGAQAFKQLGIDKLINAGDVRNAEQAFDAIVKNVNTFGSEAQKSALLAGVFGKEAGPKLLQLVEQGAGGIADLEAKAQSLGIVLSADVVKGAKDANDKLDALKKVIGAEVTGAVAALAPQIADLMTSITNSLPDLILWTEKWADWFGLIKLSQTEKLKVQISDIQDRIDAINKSTASGFRNPFGIFSAFNQKSVDELIAQKKRLENELDIQPVKITPRVAGRPDALKVGQTDAEIAKAKTLAQRRAELLAQTGVDAATASAALIVAQDTTNVQLLKGAADYYAAVKKQIDDEYQAKVTTAEAEAAKQKATLAKQGTDWKGYADGVANINKTLTDKIAAAAEEQKQKLDEAGPASLVREALIQGDQQIKQFQDETAKIGLTAGVLQKLVFMQQAYNDAKAKGIELSPENIAALNAEGDAIAKAAQSSHDAAVAINRDIQASDDLRQGLEDVGAAGLDGFKSMASAAGGFAKQIAELILRLYVLKPALESALGQPGTSSGGLVAGVFSAAKTLFGFADGGVMTPSGPRRLRRYASGGTSNSAAIFGEAGPEAAVPLPDGRSIPVNLRIPDVPKAAKNGAVVYLNIDARGAQMGVSDQIEAKLKSAIPAILAAADRQSASAFPARLQKTNRDVF